jgi:hypothetical protein
LATLKKVSYSEAQRRIKRLILFHLVSYLIEEQRKMWLGVLFMMVLLVQGDVPRDLPQLGRTFPQYFSEEICPPAATASFFTLVLKVTSSGKMTAAQVAPAFNNYQFPRCQSEYPECVVGKIGNLKESSDNQEIKKGVLITEKIAPCFTMSL